jgi:hypothetical protein
MIDTVVLNIEKGKYKFFKNRSFQQVVGNSHTKRVYNPTKNEKLEYGYLPRFEDMHALRKGGFVDFLRVEFSVPKIVHGNNFDEVNDSEFEEVCTKLKKALFYLGVAVNGNIIIKNAEISTVHYSKNIVLTDYSTPYPILRELSKINLNKHFGTGCQTFMNAGHAIRYHTNEFEIVFYDKMKDMEQAM